jgi:MOSC domain-containing protein YiiM
VAGRVELLVIAAEHSGDPIYKDAVEALAGRGIEGDRYCLAEPATGKASNGNITLIETSALDHLASLGIDVTGADVRRNVVVSGIELNDLVGQEFTVGGVRCFATELCDPCNYIEKRTKPGVLRGLVERGGIRARIVEGGTISLGDAVRRSA